VKLIKPIAKIVMWDVLSYDWVEGLAIHQAIEKMKEATHPGSIVVFHDSAKAEKNVREILPILLKYWTEKGFKFEAITA
jgi:peptidoglycan/xylan/chitin deacetylase (PgdA/CDA1 family)